MLRFGKQVPLAEELAEAQRLINAARVAGELFSSLARLRGEIDHQLHLAAKALADARLLIADAPAGDPGAWRCFESPGEATARSFTDPDEEEFLSVHQAAARLGRHVS